MYLSVLGILADVVSVSLYMFTSKLEDSSIPWSLWISWVFVVTTQLTHHGAVRVRVPCASIDAA